MSKNSNFAREIRAEGGGELASAAQQKSARFHGLPDSEIYTTEYIPAMASDLTLVLLTYIVCLQP